jgi:hypothetical protein
MLSPLAESRAEAAIIFEGGSWSASCEINPMTDKEFCSIDLSFSQTEGAMVFGKLSVYSDGSVAIAAAPQPTICSVRVDKEKAHNTTARPFCLFDQQSSCPSSKYLRHARA